jgi:hypothetical protein
LITDVFVRGRRAFAIVCVAVPLVWLATQTWRTLFIDFSGDDLMNIYHAWIVPTRSLILANLTPFTATYRPAVNGIYRLLYESFGLDPSPYRVVVYFFLALNVILLVLLAKALTNSSEIALLTGLFGSYHVRLEGLYLNGGAIYDVVCYTFFAGTLLWYVHFRSRQQPIAGVRLGIFLLLFILALNSKEMAVSLPLVLIAYECIWNWPKIRTWHGLRSLKVPLFCALITVVAVWVKIGPASPFAGNEDYTPHINLTQYVATTTRFTEELFWIRDGRLPAKAAFLILAAVWAVALLTRKRVLLLAAVIITVCPFPVDFISYRGFFVMYIPLIGWALYIATILQDLGARFRIYGVAQVLLPATMIGIILSAQGYDRRYRPTPTLEDQRQIRELREGLKRCPLNGRHAVFLLNDAFEPGAWDALYITRLYYHDVDLQIYRGKKNEAPPPESGGVLILDYVNRTYREIPALCKSCERQ